ncbi:DUF6392 family protein [Pseudomonas sp. LJDD11]|uniref:DUF6392 family protein n=1 Tax=Pseudomonas sp. LJDD11 TaxID=2931984 RepID=UPI00211C7E38|nr:DUF6392 family protein [Pseudomonas sp. LJDD11]MCQ9425754.1 DUF6392 family protein [Pseudomonas sp. LJDD11]
MNITQVQGLLSSLGKQSDAIHVEGVHTQGPLLEMFEGDDVLSITPAPGIAMSFRSVGKVFDTLVFRLLKTYPEQVVYTGALPKPFKVAMSKAEVHELLGQPLEATGPIKMPDPLGQTGGWEAFALGHEKYPGVKVVVQYNASLDVFGLVFSLMDKHS